MHNDIFISLVEAVEAQGGELLAETHVPHQIEYKIPGNHGRTRRDVLQSTGCGHESLLRFPYELETPGGTIQLKSITLCASDDRMDLMPRFAQAMND